MKNSEIKIDQVVFSVGMNMKCNKVITKSTIVRLLSAKEKKEETGYDCVINNNGCLIVSASEDLFLTRKEAKATI
jgi:hypothetical protein